MRFTSGAEPPPADETTLAVREAGAEEAAAFARMVRVTYRLPRTIEWPLARRLFRSGWRLSFPLPRARPACHLAPPAGVTVTSAVSG